LTQNQSRHKLLDSITEASSNITMPNRGFFKHNHAAEILNIQMQCSPSDFRAAKI
jgi:hypothetical protein